jgi:prepilin-type N-terminal cleavage/methylation domain-containing protein
MNNRSNLTASDTEATRQERAFTLIELLVVIAIIGILAGLLIPMAGVATAKMRLSRVQSELNSYVSAIETYKLETGEYPPDNGNLRGMNTDDRSRYLTNAALSPLYYELRGAIFTNPASFITPARNEIIPASDFLKVFNVNGLRNSARVKNDIDYKGFHPKDSQYEELDCRPYAVSKNLEILVVPVPGPLTLNGGPDGKKKINPWFYDASSTNRHNKTGFDLWAEIQIGNKTSVVANWKN